MKTFMYCGVLVENDINIPAAKTVSLINELRSFITTEQYIKRAIEEKVEVIGQAPIDSRKNIVVHLYAGKMSFSAMEKQEFSRITTSDLIKILQNKDVLYRVSRTINKTIGGILRDEITIEDVVSGTSLQMIRTKDSLDANKFRVLDLNLIDDGQPIKTEDELEEALEYDDR